MNKTTKIFSTTLPTPPPIGEVHIRINNSTANHTCLSTFRPSQREKKYPMPKSADLRSSKPKEVTPYPATHANFRARLLSADSGLGPRREGSKPQLLVWICASSKRGQVKRSEKPEMISLSLGLFFQPLASFVPKFKKWWHLNRNENKRKG